MTKQHVVFSEDCTSCTGKVRVAASKSELFLPAMTEPLAALGGRHIAICQKQLLKSLETGGGGARASAWVDSARSSSPTQIKSTASPPETEEQSSWTLRYPISALEIFEHIISASKGKQIVMFLDYDGTLSPIVDDPDQAFMSKDMREAVRDVAAYFPTAIVSGRCRDKVYNFVRLAELYYAGSHGMDIKGPSKRRKWNKGNQAVIFQAATEFLPMIDEVCKTLLNKTSSIPGAKVENNKFCLSVHFRCVEEKRWAALTEQVKMVLSAYPKLKLTRGRKYINMPGLPAGNILLKQVLEIRPTIKWDKGKALEFLLESLGYANSSNVLPIYIGDDQTDEDAFKVLRDRGQGFGILVSRVAKETSATYSLQEPFEVKEFLRRLVVERKRWLLQG